MVRRRELAHGLWKLKTKNAIDPDKKNKIIE